LPPNFSLGFPTNFQPFAFAALIITGYIPSNVQKDEMVTLR
jgi:hypothetical protein